MSVHKCLCPYMAFDLLVPSARSSLDSVALGCRREHSIDQRRVTAYEARRLRAVTTCRSRPHCVLQLRAQRCGRARPWLHRQALDQRMGSRPHYDYGRSRVILMP